VLDLVLNSLFPFSLVIDKHKRILKAGRSFSKLVKHEVEPLAPLGAWLADHEKYFTSRLAPREFRRGEAKIIGLALKLRYIEMPLDEDSALLCLSPIFTEPQVITDLGLTFSDFSELDPVIDFMMVWQSMKMTEADLEDRNRALNQKNRSLRVLSAISALAARASDRDTLLARYVSVLCEEMGWEKAHYFKLKHVEKMDTPSDHVDARHQMSFTEQDKLRWKRVLKDHPEIPMETHIHPEENSSGRNCIELICRIPSKRGPDEDEAIVLRTPGDSEHMTTEEREFYREANTFVGQTLDQLEWLRQSDENRAQLVAHSKMATLGEMAGGLAHEINNPLAVIGGRVSVLEDILKQEPLDLDKVHRDLGRIKMMVDRISKIIRGLRIFSRNAALDPMETVPVERIVSDTLDLAAERIRKAGIELRLEVDPEVKIRCRPVQISQVLMNLIMNAHDAILEQEEGKWILVQVGKTSEMVNGKKIEMVQASITDSGTGIPTDIVEKLMQPFFTTKDPGKGTGLGLSISKGIIEAHAGTLQYATHQGHTRFVIKIPA
jgi:C4-dicarboxylate-specific signal transduction histidine kinase